MLHFIERGTGKKIIFFVHGNSQSAYVWDDVLNSELLNSYRLIAVDLPGHGKSIEKKYHNDYSLRGFGVHLLELFKSFSNTDFIIVGNSLAANVIGEIITELKNCKGVFLTGATLLGTKLTLDQIVQPNPNIGICFTGEYTEEQLELLVNDAGYHLTEERKNKTKKAFREADPMMRAGLANCIGKGEFSDEILNLEKSGVPVAIVYGEQEQICFKNAMEKIAFPMWKGKTIVIPESGHCCQLDQPEKLTEIIQDFATEFLN